MQCHECGATAAYAPESGGIQVGLCERHLRLYVDELSAARPLSELEPEIEAAD